MALLLHRWASGWLVYPNVRYDAIVERDGALMALLHKVEEDEIRIVVVVHAEG